MLLLVQAIPARSSLVHSCQPPELLDWVASITSFEMRMETMPNMKVSDHPLSLRGVDTIPMYTLLGESSSLARSTRTYFSLESQMKQIGLVLAGWFSSYPQPNVTLPLSLNGWMLYLTASLHYDVIFLVVR